LADDEDVPYQIRSAAEVAQRAVILYSVVATAFGADRGVVLEWLVANGLADALSPDERTFISAADPPEKARINFSWHSERLSVLLWALGLAEMSPPDEQCDSAAAERALPPDADIAVGEFLSRARLRPDHELWGMAESIYQLHWVARDARLNGTAPRQSVDLGIIQERHHAINWITGYEGLEWDEVTTDT
jgi:hypothetical protein